MRFPVVRLHPHYAQLNGCGLGQTVEQPELRPHPWDIDRQPSSAELARQRTQQRLGTATTVVALIGGALGIANALKR